MSGLDRRAFMRQAAAAAAAAAAASLLPNAAGAGTAAAASADVEPAWKKAPCRFCGVGCGLLVAVENGRAVAVRGDPDSPVSRGLACVKGYYSVQALYGRDRLTRALVRRDGRLVAVPIDEALDLVARRLGETVEVHGKNSVALYGSGQWSITDGYVASKLFKGVLGTNNLEANARLSMSGAVGGLMTSFGLGAPMGCYEDIEHADVFVLWGTNMAETYPVLFSRLLDERQRRPGVRIVELATRTTRTSYAADRSILFAPQADLAIANAICHEIIERGQADRSFVAEYVAFKRGSTDVGYGVAADSEITDDVTDATWDEYARFLSEYTPERAEEISGVPATDIRWLASLYADPSRKVTSLWSAGANHTRGTWMNNLMYNIHLLVGKIAAPGNSPFALAGQPSGWGTVQEVGTLTDRLPQGVVTNEEDRRRAAEIWRVPAESIDPRPSYDAVSMFQAVERGEVRFLWVQGTNPMVSLPNVSRYRQGARSEECFLVVSDVYPTPTTDAADVVLPSALWIEREGLYGNAERRTQHFERMLDPPGEAMSDGWQLIEVARRLGLGELFPSDPDRHVDELWAEYIRFREDPRQRMAPLPVLRARPGVMWPYVDGRETQWRYNTALDPAAAPGRGAFDFYGNPDHRAWIWIRPYDVPPEWPDGEYPFLLSTGRVLEHWNTGSLSRRIPVLHHAVPRAYVEMNRRDAAELGIRDGETVRLVSRRGSLEIPVRLDYRAQPTPRQLFIPFFDESLPANVLTLDALDPASGQPDYKKSAVRVERTPSGAR